MPVNVGEFQFSASFLHEGDGDTETTCFIRKRVEDGWEDVATGKAKRNPVDTPNRIIANHVAIRAALKALPNAYENIASELSKELIGKLRPYPSPLNKMKAMSFREIANAFLSMDPEVQEKPLLILFEEGVIIFEQPDPRNPLSSTRPILRKIVV